MLEPLIAELSEQIADATARRALCEQQAVRPAGGGVDRSFARRSAGRWRVRVQALEREIAQLLIPPAPPERNPVMAEDPLNEGRTQIEGDSLLRRAEYELLELDPSEELRINRLGRLWHSRDVMRDALYVARHVRGDDAAEQLEHLGIADRDFRQALADLHPHDEQEPQQ